MVITYLKTYAHFKYLWLKSVTKTDLSHHCAKSLIGSYDSRVNARISVTENIILDNQIYYLCGVSEPYVWKNNFHLAFEPCEDSCVVVERNGVSVTIQGAREIPITDEYIDCSLPQASSKAFSTCRNWMFANYLHYVRGM